MLSYMRSSDGSVRLCRYHGTLLLLRGGGGPNLVIPVSLWAAAQGRPDLALPLISREASEWCEAATTTSDG